ncbi:response regulator [Tolypothrix sp. PCC 7910]|uniref:ATP-binding protein n=1 Tax=Tolypothrix sp. PCC 7910 TaxID=2099387 RepID=UPI0014279F48|nr:ATP-binding protein [Tolypothrix sp. PCC 7910]QIR40110.1 response regulator [Tolypothrix sp. PCC 7910]
MVTKIELRSISSDIKKTVPNYFRVNSSESAFSQEDIATDKATVMLIDDQLIIGEAVCQILSSDPKISFHYISDPTQAIQEAIALSPTVILLDLVMPEMDGLMLLRWFRSHPATRDIPIVMLSSKEEAKVKAEAFAAGANDYLIKLPDPVELIARIRYHSKAYNNLKALTTATINAQLQAQELEHTVKQLQTTQVQLVQTEKMSSLGRMVAGLAHEINNPINFMQGNFKYLDNHIQSLVDLIQAYQQEYPQFNAVIEEKSSDINLEFILEDLPKILTSMKIGSERISEMILSLRNFARLDQAGSKKVNIHEGIESTLLLLKHRIRQDIKIVKDYSNLPLIECYPAELNQVFMNVLNNAIDAVLEQHDKAQDKQIIIKTEITELATVKITITDNGIGIKPEIQAKIFDPFFTTKPVNKGTGLGLSISYQIIEEHQGKISLKSDLGHGTEFVIEIPVQLNQP